MLIFRYPGNALASAGKNPEETICGAADRFADRSCPEPASDLGPNQLYSELSSGVRWIGVMTMAAVERFLYGEHSQRWEVGASLGAEWGGEKPRDRAPNSVVQKVPWQKKASLLRENEPDSSPRMSSHCASLYFYCKAMAK